MADPARSLATRDGRNQLANDGIARAALLIRFPALSTKGLTHSSNSWTATRAQYQGVEVI